MDSVVVTLKDSVKKETFNTVILPEDFGTYYGLNDRYYFLSQIVSPISSYVHSLALELLPTDLRPLYADHLYVDSALFIPAESALKDLRLIISNLIPSLSIAGTFIKSGEVLDSVLVNNQFIHVEAFKVVDGVWFRIDPTQFFQPVLDTRVNVEFDCNDVVVYVGGMVVERRLLESADVVMEMIGDPLVESESQ